MTLKQTASHPIGTPAAIAAAVLFWATIGMVKEAAAMGALAILGVRITGATLILTLILILFCRQEALDFLAKTRSHLLLISLAALLIGTAFFLFAWAFLHGDAAHVAQAYLLLPFSMSLAGLLLFGEQLRPLQWLGFGLAAVGVTHELTVHGVISWVTIVQTSSLTSYFVLHRYLHQRGCTPMQLLVAEFWLLFPVALGCLWIEAARIKPFLSSIEGMAVMMGLWIVTALAYVSYIVSNRYLSCAAFGLWGNLEPVLILLGSVLLFGEPLHRSDLYTYLPMLLGTLLVVW